MFTSVIPLRESICKQVGEAIHIEDGRNTAYGALKLYHLAYSK
jgi:hypothetical protein